MSHDASTALKTARRTYEDAKHASDLARTNLRYAETQLNRAIEEDPEGATALKLKPVGKGAGKKDDE